MDSTFQPSNGVFHARAGWTGGDSFTYHATDGIDAGNIATVTIGVMNTIPVVENDGPYTVATGDWVTVDPPGLRWNDFDPDNDKFSLHVETGPAHGALSYFDADWNLDGEGDGGFTYTAALGYAGADYFTYYADDGVLDSQGNPAGRSELAMVTIEVLPKSSRVRETHHIAIDKSRPMMTHSSW